MTPLPLAKYLVSHFKPSGIVLEPCRGTGNFVKALEENGHDISEILWCEILEGKDFFDFCENVDWIITNPPFSKMRKFLTHSFEISLNVCFIMSVNHLWTRARRDDRERYNFGIKEIHLIDYPSEFPKTGFELGMVHLQKYYAGPIYLTKMEEIDEK